MGDTVLDIRQRSKPIEIGRFGKGEIYGTIYEIREGW